MSYSGFINSTELINVETLSARPGPEMNVVRAFHRLVLAHINDELKVRCWRLFQPRLHRYNRIMGPTGPFQVT